ncbi:MAG TPA: ATP-dependent protease ATPase subunit HslU [Planctomycetes bacterium]|nr:ATP-dependent protease ATPase subunit HslU [Fuerstiella sp.]HIK92421.1 ATP-dependent protease ATPase subunit HslU [Planctomycetota bacterium]
MSENTTPLTPHQVVEKLSEHIVGQDSAKRAVAVALRNRWRWQNLSDEMRKEVTPRNILMIGPTGVGKTEITRRLAKLTSAPFVKVEATKYTEVGYYGRDVESVIRDLVEAAIGLVRTAKRADIEEEAKRGVEDRLLELLVPFEPSSSLSSTDENDKDAESQQSKHLRTVEKFRDMLRDGKLEDRMVELSTEQRNSPVQVLTNMGGMEQMDMDLQGMLDKMMPKQNTSRRLTVANARRVLHEQEVESLLDKDSIQEEAIHRAEETGIVFIDEIDKVCSSGEGSKSADVSRQGVQRDLLPIVEGTTVQTRYGSVSTEKIMFIAAGAFHRSRPSDLMPELQGRFPIRVELSDLTKEDFVRILTEPSGSITRQYVELLAVDGITVEYTDDGLHAIAEIAFFVNQTTQNIGARRLQTIMERLLEDVSYEAPECGHKTVVVDEAYVNGKLDDIRKDEDLSRFVL